MTYGKLSDRCLKVFVVLLIAGVWAGSVCPILWKQSPEAIIPVLSACRLVQKGWRHLFYH